MTEPLIEIQGLTKFYEKRAGLWGKKAERVIALHDLSMEVREKEIFGLVGESGSGKSTLGRLLLRLEPVDKGKILFDGLDVALLKGSALKDYLSQVQIIFQDPYQSLNPYLSVEEILHEPLEIHKKGTKRQRVEVVEETMVMVGLSPPSAFLRAYPHQLSGGQRQRVAIARAVVLRPRFLVADEPTSMLDASISAQVFDILLNFRERLGLTILFITHNLSAAYYLCDKIGVLYRGHLVEVAGSRDILSSPYHPYTMALLDAIPKFGECEFWTGYNTLQRAQDQSADPNACPFFKRCAPARMVRCSNQVPQLLEVDKGHLVACFYAEELHRELIPTGTCKLGI